MNYLFKKFSTNSNVNGYEVNNLPICNASQEIQKSVEKRVRTIIEIKTSNMDRSVIELEEEIDLIVYDHYGLNKEEIAIIEGESNA